MIQKLLEKLKQKNEYPGEYSKTGWLSLDARLEQFDRRRRRRRAMIFFLPLVFLLGLNGWLLYRSLGKAGLENPKSGLLILDTIVQKTTVYVVDTVYLHHYNTIEHYGSQRPFVFQRTPDPIGFAQSGLLTSAEIPRPAGLDPLIEKETLQGISGKNEKESIQTPLIPDLTKGYVYSNGSKPQGAIEEEENPETEAKRLPRNWEIYTGLLVSPLLSQYPGAVPAPSVDIAWKNEMNLGLDPLVAWQLIGWQQLRLEGSEKRPIPGYPVPEPPSSEAELEKVSYVSHNLIMQMGLSWHFEPIKKVTPMLGVGIAGNYRFGALQTTFFEEEEEEAYVRVRDQLSKGWAGFSGSLNAGVNWQMSRLWRMEFGASYTRMLQQKLPNGNIGHWWGLETGVFYRWK